MVHQIIIHVGGAQAGQLLIEIFVQAAAVFDHVLGELCSNIDLVTDVIALEDLPDRGFAPRIDVGSIKIIDSGAVGRHQLLFCFFEIDPVSFSGKAHAAETKHRKSVSIFIISVEHSFSSRENL